MSKSEEAMHGITFKDKIGYAMGDMGGLLTFGLVSAFLNMFYTDVLGISAARITVLMIVARIWDAVNDPMWVLLSTQGSPLNTEDSGRTYFGHLCRLR